MTECQKCFFLGILFLCILLILSKPCPKNSCDEVSCPTFDKCDLIIENVTQCGCCNLCVNYVKEDEECQPIIIQELSWPASKVRQHCPANYQCNIDKKCEFRNTNCLSNLNGYLREKNEGWLHIGKEQPQCDENGFYKPRQCLSSSMCYCVDRNGRRLFGESLLKDKDENHCRCSREMAHLKETLKGSSLSSWSENEAKILQHFLRCTASGDFDSLQCIKDECFCLDKNLEQTAFVQNRDNFRRLPCYDPNFHSEEYVRECEKELNMKLDQMKKATKQGKMLVGFDLPSCDPDGSYAPKQCKNSKCFCSDKDGNKINNYEVPRYSKEAEEMLCDCARETWFLKTNFLITRAKCTPDTGNFISAQCFENKCYCAINGIQVSKEFSGSGKPFDEVKIYCDNFVASLS